MAAAYEVVGPLAVIADHDGKKRYCYSGTAVSTADFPAAELERLAGRGLLSKIDGPKRAPKDG